ncbi:von Willebrand factor A domain-containing protein 2-like [Acanthaster planci]|uniref:von Willebrand factor A domain-containing protein 2-like n=1 Tax=Acanthaster planci TaxID=133434 RepID=A0A8B7XGZ6_ACAPL|nr:von Willebrand factor A domain-containing protein 2-like [Acanthaster planci]XP_022080068.1 von Willebrand factor A domain-containing protein 2-like [Acanthaster planci]
MPVTLRIGLIVATIVIALFTQPTRSQGTDLTTIPESFGTAVVEATVGQINRLVGVNSDLRADNRFIRRIAWVETTDGTEAFTYSDHSYHGGIWRVDRYAYDATVAMYNNPRYASVFDDIKTLMDINWSRTTWEYCRRPLYSALAARLYFHSLQPNVPQVLTSQAELWRNRYHDQPSDTVENFISKVEGLESEGCDVKQIDLVFVLDNSGSVKSENFEKTKNFVSHVVDAFDIGADRTRVGVIQYSSSVTIEFHLNTYSNKTLLQQAIGNIQYIGGGTQTVAALNVTASQAFLVENGARPDLNAVSRAAVVITDGRSQGPAAVAVPADRAREKGIAVFAIGVTNNVNMEELNAIANKPNDTYVFHVSNFDAIDNIVASLEEKTCNDPAPIRGPVVNNTLLRGDTQFLQRTVPEEGVTLAIEADQGNVVMYVSITTPNPNKAFHDYVLEATEGQGRVEVFIGPEEFLNQGNLSVETNHGGVQKREAPGRNDIDDSSPIGTVYLTIEGLQETNAFLLMVTEGDVTEPIPATAPPANGCVAVKTAYTLYIGVWLTSALATKSALF